MVSLLNDPPIVLAIPDQVVPEGATWTYSVVAADSDAPLTYQLGAGAPAGMTIDAFGRLRWVTGENNGGENYVVSVQVTDNGFPAASTVRTFSIQVAEGNTAPNLVPPGPQATAAGSPLIVRLAATDRDVPVQSLTFSLVGTVPAGLSVDPASGVVTWTPASGQVGNYSITARAEDDGSNPSSLGAEATFTISVAAAGGNTNLSPQSLGFDQVFVPVNALPAIVDLSSGFADAEDGAAALTYSLNGNTNSGLFDSVSVDPTTRQLILDFKPNTAGTAALTLRATDSGQLSATSLLQVRVTDNPYEIWLFKYFPTKDLIDPTKKPTLWGPGADPDGDGWGNVHEMTFLRNPLMPDGTPQWFELDGPLEGNWYVANLGVLRRRGSNAFVTLSIERAADLNGGVWNAVPSTQYDVELDPLGDEDDDPETEEVLFRVLLSPDDLQNSRFFRLKSTVRPNLP